MAVPPDDLTCQEIVELVTAYLEGALPPRETKRFEAHLAHCPACRDHVDDMRVTIGLVGRTPSPQLSPGIEAKLVAAFRGWRRT